MARPKKTKVDFKSIRVQPDGRYRVDIVRVLPDGQRYRRSSAFKNLEDAATFRDKVLLECKTLIDGGAVVADSTYTLSDWCDHCLHTIMPTQANRRGKNYTANTLRGYRQLIDAYIKPSIGSVKLSRLNSDHVDALIGRLSTEPLKINTKNALSRILDLAEQKGKRPANSNPCRSVRIGRTKHRRTGPTTKIVRKVKVSGEGPSTKYRVEEQSVPSGLPIESKRVLTFEEEKVLLNHVWTHHLHSSYYTPILLGLRAGLRIAESLGLDWDNVDFKRNMLRIEQQAQRVTGKGYQAVDPKSQAGFREIPMSPSLVEHLKGLKLISSSPHVVCNSHGDRRDAARCHNRLKELCEECGLGDKVERGRFLPRPTFHDLRRTCLTRLATGRVAMNISSTSVPPTVLIRISGHEDVQTLLSYYTVADDFDIRTAMAHMP